eukprot:273189-Prymnesium_polylepis.1
MVARAQPLRAGRLRGAKPVSLGGFRPSAIGGACDGVRGVWLERSHAWGRTEVCPSIYKVKDGLKKSHDAETLKPSWPTWDRDITGNIYNVKANDALLPT